MFKKILAGVLFLTLIILFPFARNAGKQYRSLKLGTALSKVNQFDLAQVFFDDMTQKCRGNTCSTGRYNLGNILYYRGESASIEEKVALWKQSLTAYDKALSYEKNDVYSNKIEHNKKVVEDKLEELGISSEDKENQQQESEQGDEGEQKENQGDQRSDQGETSQQEQGEQGESEPGSEGKDGSEGQSSAGASLSESQRQQLEQYQELLEQQQQENQEFFAPIPSSMQEQPQSLLDQFFGGDRLQKSLPQGGGVDW